MIPHFHVAGEDDPSGQMLIKIGIDEDWNDFKEHEFLRVYCEIMQINNSDIKSVILKRGSAILELTLEDAKSKIKLRVEHYVESNKDTIKKELAKLKVFLMCMGNVDDVKNAAKVRASIKFHPRWNRVYDRYHTFWTGPLRDGRDRGKYEYFCPIGWKRYALDVTNNYDEKFKGWSFCYHGTKFQFGLAILLSGLMPAGCAALGQGIYASQSIIYACHPRYAEVKEIKSAEEKQVFKNGNYIQFVLQCRVHPSGIKVVGPETLSVGNKVIVDSNLQNNVLEWVVDNKGKALMDFQDSDTNIVCTGIMVRVTDEHPGLLPESEWWYKGHLCDNENCCLKGISLHELNRRKNTKTPCRILYD